MKRQNIFLISTVVIVIIKFGLTIPKRQSSEQVTNMVEKYEEIKRETDEFTHFEDSLAGNPNFRKRLLDSISTASDLKQFRVNQGLRLTKKTDDFRILYPNIDNIKMKYKLLNGLDNLLSLVFVGLVIPLIVNLFKRR